MINRDEYLEMLPMHLGAESDVPREARASRKDGPRIWYVAHLTGFDETILADSMDARIPRSGHKIAVPADGDDEPPAVIEFELRGWGAAMDTKPGEPAQVNMRQRYAIRNSIRARERAGSAREQKPPPPVHRPMTSEEMKERGYQ